MTDKRQEQLQDLLLGLLPQDGSTLGNSQLLTRWTYAAAATGQSATEVDFNALPTGCPAALREPFETFHAARQRMDESLLDQFHGTVSPPFESGRNGKAAVKIVDDRGIESLKTLVLKTTP